MSKPRLATVWLDGCSGCHMSLLDMDERLVELSERFDLVYSPLVDYKQFPAQVDIALVEGSVSSDEDEHKIRLVRANTRILVSLGDCAVTGNVPSMRNSIPVSELLECVYRGNGLLQPQVPKDAALAAGACAPGTRSVNVDLFVSGLSTFCRHHLCGNQRLVRGTSSRRSGVVRFGA